MSLIEIANLFQRRGEREILKDASLKIERGEAFALIGPTGAGKTTLLRLINLIDTPSSGIIYFDGVDTTATGRRLEMRRCMAFVHQKPVVFNTSVYDNIAYGLKWRGVKRSQIGERVSSILDTVGLSHYKNSSARTLSGGEVQQVAIARAIVTEPELLLLDEPTANLDPASTARIEQLIKEIIDQHKTTIIMATHDMPQSQRLADRVGVILNGEIRQTGEWQEVFYSPRNRDVADFVAIENVIDGVVVSSRDSFVNIDINGQTIEAVSDCPEGEGVSACVRAEAVTLASSRLSSSARNSFVGEITRIVWLEPLVRVEVDCGFPLTALVTKRSAEELALEKGKRVYAAFKATAVHILRREKVE